MRRLVVLAAAALLTACATPRGEEQVANLVHRTVQSSRAHHQAGRLGEAAVLLRAVERVAPDDPAVEELQAEIGDEVYPLLRSERLGMNRRPRAPIERSVLARIAWYPWDRVADVFDLVSFDVGVAAGAGVQAYITRGAQLGFGFGWQYGVGLTQPRILGAQQEIEIGVAALSYTQFQLAGNRSGMTGPVVTGSADVIGASVPSLGVYQDYRDYWAIGAGVRVAVVGANVAFHPVQLADLVLGFIGIDFARDDNATTRALWFSSTDRRALIQLSEVEEVRLYAR
jgi:hypothetical protein